MYPQKINSNLNNNTILQFIRSFWSKWTRICDIIIDMVFLLSLNVIIAGISWGRTGVYGAGDWPYLGERWFEGSIPFPPYWGSGTLLTGGVWSIGVDGAMHAWFSVSTTIASYFQLILGHPSAANFVFLALSPLAGGILFAYPFMRRAVRGRVPTIVSCVTYSWNSHQVLGAVGGQWLVVACASLFPFLAWLIVRQLESKQIVNNKIMYICAVWGAIALLDPRFAIVALIPMAIIICSYFRVHLLRAHAKFIVYIALGSSLFTAVLQAPWLVAMMSSGGMNAVPSDRLDVSNVFNLSYVTLRNITSLRHTLWPAFMVWDVSGLWLLESTLLVFGVAVIAGSYLGRKDILIIASSIIFVCGAMLSKGTNGPIEGLYPWAFVHVPGMNLFRDPIKWFVCVMLGAAPIIGLFWGKLYECLYGPKFGLRLLAGCALTILTLATVAPVVPLFMAASNLRGNSLRAAHLDLEASSLNREILAQDAPFRMLVVPWGDQMIEHSQSRQILTLYHLMGGAWSDFAPHGETMRDKYEKLFRSEFFRTLLWMSNIKYIIVPNDYQGIVFGRDKKGHSYDVPGFADTAQLIEHNSQILRRESYRDFAVFDTGELAGPVYAVSQLRGGTRASLHQNGSVGFAPIFSDLELASQEIVLALPDDVSATVRLETVTINRTRYIGRLSQSQAGWVVLSEPFAEGWEAFIVPRGIHADAVRSIWTGVPFLRGSWWWIWPGVATTLDQWRVLNHVRVNGYMQAWLSEFPGEYEVFIEYRPQRAYELGWLVTLSALGSLGLVGVIWCVRLGVKWLRLVVR